LSIEDVSNVLGSTATVKREWATAEAGCLPNSSDRQAGAMTPEQWQQIKTVLAVALEVDDPGRRAAYLDEVCGTDRWMRDEVDRLLRADAMAGTQFLANSPLTDPSARGERQTDPLIGRRVGGYQILDLIGVGGMGEVYRARDTKLGREVALRLLPSEFIHDPERIARFGREAQLLAALNHPHIAAITDSEDSDGCARWY
jgi:hypothetical protein